MYKGEPKPELGEGLNKPATVHLYNCFGKFTPERHAKKLVRMCEKQGLKFISYDLATGEWVFYASHFSKYTV